MSATRAAPPPSPIRTKMNPTDSANRDGTLASTPHFNSPPPAPGAGRDRSSSRRRLSTSLGNLLGKRSDSSTSSVLASSPASDGSNGVATAAPPRGSLTSRRPSVEAASAAPSINPSSTSGSRSKPPVSLPKFFRRRLSSSASAAGTDAAPTTSSPPSSSVDASARRPSFDIGRAHHRAASEDSTDYTQDSTDYTPATNVVQLRGERTDSGTTSSSREAPTSSSSRGGMSPASAITSQSSYIRRDSRGSTLSEDGRTRSPDAEEQEESMSSGSDVEDEDIRDFVRASAGSSVSPHATPASPFSTHSRLSALSDDAVPNLESPSSEEASSRPVSPPPIQARRLTASNLALPNLPRAGSSSPAPPPASSNADSRAVPASRPHSNSFTERRLRTLPRLLSNDTHNFAALRQQSAPVLGASTVAEGDEVATGESETETETETEDEDDESAASSPSDPIPSSSNMETSTSTITRTTPTTNSTTPRALGLGMTASTSAAPSVPPNWVTFDPVTPTPGHVRTARIADSAGPSDSYFDLPRPLGSNSTPGAALMTPLLPQSLSNVARGQRPTRHDDVERTRSPATTPGRGGLIVPNAERLSTTSAAVDGAEVGSPTYRRRANSAAAIMSPSLLDSDEEPVGTAAQELDPVWQSSGLATPGPSFLSPALSTTITSESKKPSAPSSPVLARPSTAGSRLHRPRSMYELHVAPPAYHSVYERAGFGPNQIVFPREEEGKEGLPDYTCAIHIEGYMPRKMEFTAPSVQAKDRAWKRQYVVLHGTSIKFYKYDLKTHPIAGEEDWADASPEMAGRDGPPPLHFHAGEYGVDGTAASSKFPTSMHDVRAKAKSRIVQATTASDTNVLLRHYSLQNAESGLAADYIKRKHVVRVRAEGEQFLLQTSGDRGTIDLIEVLQAATNVALDLDTRPLPKFITLPRRRRRRRRPDAATAGANGPAAAATTGAAGGAEGANGASQAAADEPDRMGDMLAEEQNAYSSTRETASAV